MRAATRFIVLPDYPSISQPVGGTPVTGPDVTVEFQQNGYIIGFACDTKASFTQSLNYSMGVRIVTGGSSQAITTDGDLAVFIPANLLCGVGQGAVPGPRVAPLVRRVRCNDRLNVAFSYFNPTVAPPFIPASINPIGGFWFLRDEDLPDGCEPMPLWADLPPATRFVLVPGQPDAATGIAPGVKSQDGIVNFQQHGLVTAFAATGNQVNDNDNGFDQNLSSLAAAIQVVGSEAALTSNGTSFTWAPLSLLMPSPLGLMPLCRRVAIRDKYRVSFKNIDPTRTLQPFGCFYVRCDADIAARDLSGN